MLVHPYNSSYQRNVASLSLLNHYFHRKCPHAKHFLIPPFLTIPTKVRHATHSIANRPRSLRISLLICMFHLSSFFLRTTGLCNQLPKGCFPDHYNLKPFKSRVNYYISHISPYVYSLLCNVLYRVALWLCTE